MRSALELSIKAGKASHWDELISLTLEYFQDTESLISTSWNELTHDLGLIQAPSIGFDQDQVNKSLPIIQERLPIDHPVLLNAQKGKYIDSILQRSDFVSDRKFKNTMLYQEAYKHFGELHQLVCPLAIEKEFILVLTLGRDSREFDPKEINRIEMAQSLIAPHVKRILDSSKDSETIKVLTKGLEGKAGIIRLDNHLNVVNCNLKAVEWMEIYFSHNLYQKNLPERLLRRVKENVTSSNRQSFRVATAEGEPALYGHLLHNDSVGGYLLVLFNEVSPFAHHDWESLSLREQQVVQGLARGLCIDKIADELRVSASTVRTYLHRIGGKMDATNPNSMEILMSFLRDFH